MRSRDMHTLRLALAQLNLTVGDIEGNTEKIIANIREARQRGADLVVFPGTGRHGLSAGGSAPQAELRGGQPRRARTRSPPRPTGITAIVGFVDVDADIYQRRRGSSQRPHCRDPAQVFPAQLRRIRRGPVLPGRHEDAGLYARWRDVRRGGLRGRVVCRRAPQPADADGRGAVDHRHQLLAVPRGQVALSRARCWGRGRGTTPALFVYLNAVGGQDELVFDGQSLVVGPSGEVVFRCEAFEEQLAIVDVDLSLVEHQRLVDPRRRKAKLARSGGRAECGPGAGRDVAPRNGEASRHPPSRRGSWRRSTRRWCWARGTM